MGSTTSINVNINAAITVDRKTAEICLSLVQTYVNSHPGTDVAYSYKETGELELYFVGEPDVVL